MAFFGYGALAALGGALIYSNLPTYITLGYAEPSFEHLTAAKLVPITGKSNEIESVIDKNLVTGGELFQKGPVLVMAVRRPGCLLCRKEAAQLETLKPILDKNGISLVAVVHELLGANKFKDFFSGDLYLDVDKTFYGPRERWLPIWMGFLRFSTYTNVYNAKKANVKGDLVGEGRLLGGVFLIANNKIQYCHLEKSWGDAANIGEVTEALRRFEIKQ